MKYITLLIVCLCMISCHRQPAALTREEAQAVTDSIKQTLADYYNDVRASGLTAEFKYLDHSPEFFWVPPGYTSAISYDSVAAVLTRNAPLLSSIDNMPDTVRIIPLSKELAAYTARLRSTVTDTKGNATTTTLIETGVMIKRNDGWKLLNGQTAIIPGTR